MPSEPEIPPRFPYLKSLNISWKEGIPASVMQAIIDYYLIPLALFLGATPVQIGLLVAIPNLLGSLAQLFAVELVALLGSHLRFLVVASTLQAALLVPVCLLPLTSFSGRIEVLIILIGVFRILANIIQTVWGALVSQYLPPEERGKYFGWRSQIQGQATMATVAGAGVILYAMKSISLATGFFLVCALMAGSRFLSARLMGQMEHVEVPQTPQDDFTFWMFVRRLRKSNFVRFVLFVAGITFATNLAGPYFSVYMFQELHFSYLQYFIMQVLLILASLVGYPFWGRWADRAGNVKMLQRSAFFIPLIPLLWLLTDNFFILCFYEMLSGFIWAGFNLCALNFIYDAVSPAKRTRCLSYFYLITGIALFLGASLGGLLAEHLPKVLDSKILCLFLLSGVLRVFFYGILGKSFCEVRPLAQGTGRLDRFFNVMSIRFLFGESESAEDRSFFSKPEWLKPLPKKPGSSKP